MYGLETLKRINAEARASGLDIKAYRDSLPAAVDVATDEEVRYTGHRPDGDPVQKHSAGPLYPFIVYKQGETDYLMVGDVAVRVPSRAVAEQLVAEAEQLVAEARTLKAQNAAAGYPALAYDEALKRVAGINALPWEPFRRAA